MFQAALKYNKYEEGENQVLEISSDNNFCKVYSEKDTEETSHLLIKRRMMMMLPL